MSRQETVPRFAAWEYRESHPLVARVRDDLAATGVLSVPVWREFFRSLGDLGDGDLLTVVDALERGCAAGERPLPPPAHTVSSEGA